MSGGLLSHYNEKRHFGKTDEPPGTPAKKRARQLRFVVQHHIASRDHYDFRLEWNGVLKSWAVPKGPSSDSRDKRLAVQVEDHPFDYRNFEGTIPQGEYGGGTVMIWDEGTWLPLGDAADMFAKGSLKFTLEGKRLKGKWALVRMKPKEGEKNTNWLLIKERDEYENTFNIGDLITSVKTERTMAEIAEGKKKSKRANKGKPSPSLADFGITHAEKVLDEESGGTKGDVAAYYLKISPRMLPYLDNRILSAVRCPAGIAKPCFYKKHPAKDNRGVVAVPVTSSDGTVGDYYYVNDLKGLMAEVQMNTLEFHTWGSRVDRLEHPDIMVLDLDPDEGMELERIRQGVRDLKSILDNLSLGSYLKTSGGKGYHVVIPFKPAPDWASFQTFAHNMAKTMEAKWPDRYTGNVRKNKRNNRIFIDWIRNGRGATSVAPYSIRARKGLPVSMPISWKELDSVAPQDITMEKAVAGMRRKDPWEGFFEPLAAAAPPSGQSGEPESKKNPPRRVRPLADSGSFVCSEA